MRDYGKVAPQFWTGETGKKIRAAGSRAQVIACYLLTCPSSTMLGLYYLPLPTLCHEVGCSLQEAQKALRSLSQADFAFYDESSEFVWIPNMARFQIGDFLKPGDKRITGISNALQKLKTSPFFNNFLQLYREDFHLDGLSPTEAPSMPLDSPSEASRAVEQEQRAVEQKQDLPPAVDLEFEEFWKLYPERNGKRIGKSAALAKFKKLDPENRCLIINAVKNYAASEMISKGIGIKDPHRWLRDGKGDEPWRDWLTPEVKPKEKANGKTWQRPTGLAQKDYAAGSF